MVDHSLRSCHHVVDSGRRRLDIENDRILDAYRSTEVWMHSDGQRRLLIVTEWLGFGGTETHLVRLLPRLADAGWRINVFCLTARGARAGLLEEAGIEIFAPSRERRTSRGLFHLAGSVSRLARLVRRFWPHIVHFYLPGPYLMGAPVTMAAGAPVKVMSRRSLANYQQKWPIAGRLERLLHTRMQAVIGNSKAVVGELLAEGVPPDKARLIYNGIDRFVVPSRTEARTQLGLDDRSFVGAVVANLIPYKGHRELVEALSIVKNELPPDWRILCAGRDEGLKSELQALARARGVAENVLFIGELTDIAPLLGAADFSLLTSREEGFSNAILEAMSAGLPMIVTSVGGNPEAVLDEETGLVVPPGDARSIGAAILRFANDPDLRLRLGDAGRKRVRQAFSLEACLEAHAMLYENLLEGADVPEEPS